MNIKIIVSLIALLSVNVFSQNEDILVQLVDIMSKKINILTENGSISIEEKSKGIQNGNPESLALGMNLYKSNLIDKYLQGMTNKELIDLFLDEYNLGSKREKDLLDKMTLSKTAIKAYASLLKDEAKVIKKLTAKYK